MALILRLTKGKALTYQELDNNFTGAASDLANTSDPTLGDALVGFKQSNASGLLTGAVARTVHQKLQESVSVLDFGAVGDGVTDDTAAFQAAINSNLPIYVPGVASSYLISGNLTITASGVRLRGDGYRSAIKLQNSGVCLDISGGIESIDLVSLLFTSTSTTNTLIRAKGINDQFRIGGCYFNGGGIQLLLTSGVASSGIYGVHIHDTAFFAAGVRALHINPATLGFAQALYFYNCEFQGNVQHVYATSANGWYFHHCRFERNTVSSPAVAVHIDGTNTCVIDDCYFEENDPNIDVLEIGSNVNNLVVSNNYFTVNPSGSSSLRCLVATNGGSCQNWTFNNNYISAGGTLTGNCVDFGSVSQLTCRSNSLVVSTVSGIGINTTASAQVVDLGLNTFSGTFTGGKTATPQDIFKAKVLLQYNGATSTNIASYGVSSVTKNGTGDYTVNFSTSFTNSNYFASVAAFTAGVSVSPRIYSRATGSISIAVANSAFVAQDAAIDVIIFGPV